MFRFNLPHYVCSSKPIHISCLNGSCDFAAETLHHSWEHLTFFVAVKSTTQNNLYHQEHHLTGQASLSYTATLQVCQKITQAYTVDIHSNKAAKDTYHDRICIEVVCVQFLIAAFICNSY